MHKIVVVGSINEDISLKVASFPLEGETMLSSGAYINNGGKGANQAVAAARLGGDVALIGAIGSDASGAKMKDMFAQEGIDVSGIVTKDTTSGFAVIMVNPSGHNSIIVEPGANGAVTIADIEANKAAITNASYCLLQHEIPLEVVEYVITLCHTHGVKVILNPAPFDDALNRDLLKQVYLFVPNEHEFAQTLHQEHTLFEDIETLKPYLSDFAVAYGVNTIVTLGSQGSLLCTSEGDFEFVEANKVNAIDTTAAGDTFIGALSASLSNGHSLLESMKFATKASGIAVSRQGAQISIPTLNEM